MKKEQNEEQQKLHLATEMWSKWYSEYCEKEKEVAQLKTQLDEANMVILSLPAEKISTCMIACEYLDKWGVK